MTGSPCQNIELVWILSVKCNVYFFPLCLFFIVSSSQECPLEEKSFLVFDFLFYRLIFVMDLAPVTPLKKGDKISMRPSWKKRKRKWTYHFFQAQAGHSSLWVEIDLRIEFRFIRIDCIQTLHSAVVNYARSGSLVHVMIWTSQGLLSFFLPCTVYCKEPYMVLKAWKLLSQHEVSLLQQNTRAPREEGLLVVSTKGEWDGWPGACFYVAVV